MSAEKESSWIEGLRAGDSDSYREVVESTIGKLLVVARRYLNEDDARDAVQDTYLKLLSSIEKFRGDSSLLTWLQRILINECLMRLRKQKNRHETSIDEYLPSYLEDGHRVNPQPVWPDNYNTVLTREQRCNQVQANLMKLPEDYRLVIMLRDIEGFSGKEAAETLGISLAAVKVRLHRARQALRELLEPLMLEEAGDL